MATVNHAISPKEFTCWIKAESTAGTSVISTSAMYQLDVDSVGYPSLNVTQALDVRSGKGRTFKDEDFFQDNKIRTVELSLSGTMHNDIAHKLLLKNICNYDGASDIPVPTGGSAASQLYGASAANDTSSLTVVISASETTNQKTFEFSGMVVTNFTLSADNGTEGGRYKFSATLQSGKVPDLADTNVAGSTAYAINTTAFLSSSSGHKVFDVDVIMNSFTCAIENPAVFTGATSTGYALVSRGAETAVTVDTQIKWDGNTKGFPNSFDTQTAYKEDDMFVITNNNALGVDVQNGVFKNVALSEGDIMALDCSIKSVDNGADALVTFDVTS